MVTINEQIFGSLGFVFRATSPYELPFTAARMNNICGGGRGHSIGHFLYFFGYEKAFLCGLRWRGRRSPGQWRGRQSVS